MADKKRTIKVTITVQERTQGEYVSDTLQTQELTFPLPIDFAVIGKSIIRMTDALMAIQADVDRAQLHDDEEPVTAEAAR